MLPLLVATGAMKAVAPIIARILNILLPNTLPIAMSVLPFMADNTLTTNSGALLPTATIVIPMTRVEMPTRFAMAEAPSVIQSAPFIINSSPTRNWAMNNNVCIVSSF